MARGEKPLSRYNAKRDFSITQEPEGVLGKKQGFGYLIQKHAATRLHYDFRLELDGVLKSWAVTRGPSLDPADKRLAVEVEDHPVKYGAFEGIIPRGQYGGGTVMLWDRGTWEPLDDPHEGLRKGNLKFTLHGERLKGEWALVRMHGRKPGDEKRHNWLLIKHDDKLARRGKGASLVEANLPSIASNRSMEEIASAGDNVWQSNRESSAKSLREAQRPGNPDAGKERAGLPRRARKDRKGVKLPGFIAPQLATLSDGMPGGEGWVHEIKFDGYRVQAHVSDGEATLYTRTGKDWTAKFGELADELANLHTDCILDGEVVAMDDHGVTSFKRLQDALSEGPNAALQYYAFDLLHESKTDWTKKPLLERKVRLKEILEDAGESVFYSAHFTRGPEFLNKACSLRLEGVISKRADAPYRSGRSKEWLKAKCHQRQEFVIGGFTEPTRGGLGIGSMLLGYYDGKKLIYAGKVGTGLTSEDSRLMRKRLEKIERKDMPFESVTAEGRRGARYVEPSLVCEVEFTEWTPDGHLRHPSFQGLREDKRAAVIRREVPVHAPKTTGKIAATAVKDAKGRVPVDGVGISSPGRVIFPEDGYTKLQLAQYYAAVRDHILPQVTQRPLSMMRCPEGTGEPCFFQRHIAHGQPNLHEVDVGIKGRIEQYLYIKDEAGLLTLAQWGVIELHPWGCRVDAVDKADRLIIDLDPDPEVKWPAMVKAAREVKERLSELGLESWLKTTGGKGLHIVAPLTPTYGWPAIKAFARAIAESMERDAPQAYIATMSKAKRKGRIFVDYLRNDHTATAVAAYSVRARPGAPVAMPLEWGELTLKLKPAQFTLASVPGYLKQRKKDPWAGMAKKRQTIKPAYLKALGIEPV